MIRTLVLTALLAPTTVIAEAPDPRTPAPVLYLADNLDEPRSQGFCLDTVGNGFAGTLHAHTCKPQGADTQHQWDPESGQIHAVNFEGYCTEITSTDPASVEFLLTSCTDASGQKFTMENGLIRPADAPDLCLGVADTTQPAGPMVKRALVLAECASTGRALIEWVQVD